MLNGAAPVLLIYFTEKIHTGWVVEDGKYTSTYKTKYKTPIPIYLDEKLTGLYVDQDNEQLEINSESIANINDKKGVEILQKGEKQTVTVELIGNKNSIGLNLLLPLLKTLYDYALRGKEYKIAYFNKNILIFNARLARYQKLEGRTNDLIALTIELEVSPEQKEEEEKTQLQAGNTDDITDVYDASPQRSFTVETTTTNAAGTLTQQKVVTMSKDTSWLPPVSKRLD